MVKFDHMKPDKGEEEDDMSGIDKSNLSSVQPDLWKID